MIVNARVLQDEFIPKEVKHRDQETQTLVYNLKPLNNDEGANNTFIHGSSGVGKTCISKYVIQKLREEVLEINYQYVNCWQDYNRFKVLYRLLEGLNDTKNIHRMSTPKDKMIDRIKNKNDLPYIVILDEADQLEDKKVLYDLYTMESVYFIIISNLLEPFFADMDQRIRSRLNTITKIEFKPYTSEELTTILKDRTEWGLKPGTIDKEHLNLIARNSDGDARVAITTLRQAVKTAQNQNKKKINEEIINESIPIAIETNKQSIIDNLNDHQRKLYDIIDNEGKISPGKLYEKYRDKMENPRTNRTLRSYMKKLESYKLVKSKGNNKAKTYQTT